MDNTQYINILQNPESIDTLITEQLEEIINEFPYFQSARAILLKGLYKTNSSKYNPALKKTAAYTVDRKVLFNFITSPIFITKTTSTDELLEDPEIIEAETLELPEKISDTISSSKSEEIKPPIIKDQATPEVEQKETETLEIEKPIQFNSSVPHSFNEWMQLITQKPIIREEKTIDKIGIIDTFIETNPKIKPIDKNAKYIDASPESSTENDSLMTETLAKIYVEQKKYEKSIKAYHILCLKYPEKSGFFADRIKAIKKLQRNKS